MKARALREVGWWLLVILALPVLVFLAVLEDIYERLR